MMVALARRRTGVMGKHKPSVAVIGPGRVGGAIGRRLREAGYRIAAVASRSLASARKGARFIGAGRAFGSPARAAEQATLVLLSVPDDRIHAVCERIATGGGFSRAQVVVHFSGLLPSDVLDPARGCGAAVASCHPLQTFATSRDALRLLAGSTFALEGDPRAMPTVRAMVRALGGKAVAIPTDAKVPYHAAAVMACNYLVVLLDAALSVYDEAGMGGQGAMRALRPLLDGTLANVERLGGPGALTGPIARGDVGVVRVHLEWLATHRPDLVTLYVELGRSAVALARRKGTLDAPGARALRRVLGSFA